MFSIDGTQRTQLRTHLAWFQNHIASDLIHVVIDQVPYGGRPEEFSAVTRALEALLNELSKQPVDGPVSLDDLVLPAAKRVILARRAALAAEIEQQRQRTMHHELLSHLDKKLQLFDVILQTPQMRDVRPLEIPRLSDFLSIERIVDLGYAKSLPGGRQYDEKFHILQAPRQFLPDLKQMRTECDMRRRSVAVSYIDIDDFKIKFNSKIGESAVDRDVLPRFMQEIEGFVFSHGYAYRFGGDEYVVLLPNQTRQSAIHFMDGLRSSLASLIFRGTPERTTVSIGVVVVEPDSPFTEQEVQQKANAAKNFAKSHGKNCIAAFSDVNLDDASLKVVSPAE